MWLFDGTFLTSTSRYPSRDVFFFMLLLIKVAINFNCDFHQLSKLHTYLIRSELDNIPIDKSIKYGDITAPLGITDWNLKEI